MDEDKGYLITCPRCGADMYSNSRYCMKCGNLNYDHEANKNMRPYIENQIQTYEVGSGQFGVQQNMNSNQIRTNIANRTGSKRSCFYFTFGFFLFLIVGSFFLTVDITSLDLEFIMKSSFPIISIILSIVFFYLYAIELLVMKCNRPWWSIFIPIYNMIVLSDIVFKKSWIGFLTIIPGIGQIIQIVLFYKLGEKFKVSGLGMVILPFIYIPLIGYGHYLFEGNQYLSKNEGENFLEKEYKFRKIFIFFTLLFFLLGVALLVLANFNDVEQGAQNSQNYYYVFAGKRFVSKTKKAIEKGTINCFGKTYSSESGIYYFYYSDISDVVYLPLYYMREVISGYVKVENINGTSQYYVSISDGTNGIRETLGENLNGEMVTSFDGNFDTKSFGITCQIE